MLNTPTSEKTRTVALLIDGDNLSHGLADKIIAQAEKFGTVRIKRVYGNPNGFNSWDGRPGFKTIHSGSIKEGTDILLSIEAVALSYTHNIDTFIIATSDHDLSHVVFNLKERGFTVAGIGTANAPETFRQACSSFVEITLGKPNIKRLSNVDRLVYDMLDKAESKKLSIVELGRRMHQEHDLQLKKLEKSKGETWPRWRDYLLNNPELYRVDTSGDESVVHLVVSE